MRRRRPFPARAARPGGCVPQAEGSPRRCRRLPPQGRQPPPPPPLRAAARRAPLRRRGPGVPANAPTKPAAWAPAVSVLEAAVRGAVGRGAGQMCRPSSRLGPGPPRGETPFPPRASASALCALPPPPRSSRSPPGGAGRGHPIGTPCAPACLWKPLPTPSGPDARCPRSPPPAASQGGGGWAQAACLSALPGRRGALEAGGFLSLLHCLLEAQGLTRTCPSQLGERVGLGLAFPGPRAEGPLSPGLQGEAAAAPLAWGEPGVLPEGPGAGRGLPGSEGLPSAALRLMVLAGCGGLCLAHSPAALGPSHHP